MTDVVHFSENCDNFLVVFGVKKFQYNLRNIRKSPKIRKLLKNLSEILINALKDTSESANTTKITAILLDTSSYNNAKQN